MEYDNLLLTLQEEKYQRIKGFAETCAAVSTTNLTQVFAKFTHNSPRFLVMVNSVGSEI